jgi:hypothetical protein
MGLLAKAAKDWTNAVIRMAQAGIPTKELAGNTVFTDRLRKYDVGMDRLGTMRPKYVANQKKPNPDPEIAKQYHKAMDPLQREGRALNAIAKNYGMVISKWTIKYLNNPPVLAVVRSAIVPSNHIEVFTDVTVNVLFEIIKPPRPIRRDKPPAIPPRPGQRSQGQEEAVYSNDPNYN